jgi:hypothetical protein
MSLAKKYQKSLTEKWCLRFKTRNPDGDNYDGVVMLNQPNFIVIHEKREFEFDGVILLPKRIIKGWRDGKFESCTNKIIRQNGEIKKLRIPAWLSNCKTIQQVLIELMDREIWPGIEYLKNERTVSAFYLGPITGSGDTGFWLYCYDAAGKWEKEYFLNYKKIFKIEINSKYCKHFNKFMKSQNESK